MNILLLEPEYKNKYPPLSLMKIATFHKERGDTVVFVKGEDKKIIGQTFDRIYINSLFSFEWSLTRKAIDFAYKLTDNKQDIYLGGITATILTEFVHQEAPDINIVTGLLDTPGKLKLPLDETIDSLPPDYSILQQIEYKYPSEDDYIMYATRGCGMNCSFCAVQRLEPHFIDYICIKQQIQTIREKNGEKRNLLLMDNNVLRSPRFKDIIQDIVDLGYGRGVKFHSPKSKRMVRRYVDFNQGLDANLITKEKAEQLARIELKPTRIAFDHITQTEKYLRAVRLCFDAGLRNFSNYILYNSDEAIWKGQAYMADTPADLYKRLRINVDFCEQLQQELRDKNIKETVSIYSFPMRYIPLSDTKRGYVGKYWNKKHLRAIQVFITPTQGKGVCSLAFFNASFGQTLEEFQIFLDMPENLLVRRGIYVENPKHTEEEKALKKATAAYNHELIQEWYSLYHQIKDQNKWQDFAEQYLYSNKFPLENLYSITDPILKEMYVYYMSIESLWKNIQRMPAAEQEFMINTFIKGNKHFTKLFYNPQQELYQNYQLI